eukprot:3856841-Alexandrium_andersonii.AAC.1
MAIATQTADSGTSKHQFWRWRGRSLGGSVGEATPRRGKARDCPKALNAPHARLQCCTSGAAQESGTLWISVSKTQEYETAVEYE